MSKQAQLVEIAADELTYLPTAEQRKAKSAFWARFYENPTCEPSQISGAMAGRIAGDSRIPAKWWPQAGFREWFINQDEFRQRLEYLAQLSLDTLETVLVDPKAQSSAKVNAAKLLLEVARKMPPKHSQEKFLDEKVAAMSRKELEDYLRRSVSALPEAKSG